MWGEILYSPEILVYCSLEGDLDILVVGCVGCLLHSLERCWCPEVLELSSVPHYHSVSILLVSPTPSTSRQNPYFT